MSGRIGSLWLALLAVGAVMAAGCGRDGTPPGVPVPEITSPADGSLTNVARPTLEGTAPVDHTISVLVDGTTAATGIDVDGGVWSWSFAIDLADGEYTVTAIATSSGGRDSDESAPVTFTVDRTPPDAPVISSPSAGWITSTPTISGTAEGLATVEVFADATSIGTVPASATGEWALVVTTPLANGDATLTATATDAAGNTSDPSAGVEVAVDGVPPAIDFFSFVTDFDEDYHDSSIVVIWYGVVATNSPITHYSLSTTGSTPIFPDGFDEWEDILSYNFGDDGQYTLYFWVRDAAGNLSDRAQASIGIDTARPVVTQFDLTSDAITNDPVVTFDWDAEDATGPAVSGIRRWWVSLSDTPPPAASMESAEEDAFYTFDLTLLGDGDYSLYPWVMDGAGNVSAAFAPITVTLDREPPDAPLVTTPADGALTSDAQLSIVGSAEFFATVHVLLEKDGADDILLEADADAVGYWSVTPDQDLEDGLWTLTATATDFAGNASLDDTSVTFTVDATPPAVVSIVPVGGATDVDLSVTVVVTFGEPLDPATVDGSSFVLTYAGPTVVDCDVTLLAEGTVVHVTPDELLGIGRLHTLTIAGSVKDIAGNALSGAPVTSQFTTGDQDDTVAPVITRFEFVSGFDPNWHNNLTVPLLFEAEDVGTGVQGYAVDTESDPAAKVFTEDAPASHTFPAAGTHTLYGWARDGATPEPNVSGRAEASISIDIQAPEITAFYHDYYTAFRSVSLTAEADDGLMNASGIRKWWFVVWHDDDDEPDAPGADDVEDEGTDTAPTAIDLPDVDGLYNVWAYVIDNAGNLSARTSTQLILDRIAPDAPEITSPESGATNASNLDFEGTAEPLSTVRLLDGSTEVANTSALLDGTWELTVTNPTPGTHVYTATATDAAGNVSDASQAVTILIDRIIPDIVFNDKITSSTSPRLAGFATDASSGVDIDTLTVTIGGNAYTAPDIVYDAATGAWHLPAGTISPALGFGDNNVTVRVEDFAGNHRLVSRTVTVVDGPTVTWSEPWDEAENIQPGVTIRIYFSRDMDKPSVEASVSLVGETTGEVPLIFEWDGADSVSVIPDTAAPLGTATNADILPQGEEWTLTVFTDAKDDGTLHGAKVALSDKYVVTFDTHPWQTQPHVVEVLFGEGAGVDALTGPVSEADTEAGSQFQVVFDQLMDDNSVRFRVRGANVYTEFNSNAWQADEKTLVFTLNLDLTPGNYDAEISDFKAKDGWHGWFRFVIQVAPASPTTDAMTVVSTLPLAGSVDVPCKSLIALQFSEPVVIDSLGGVVISGDGVETGDFELQHDFEMNQVLFFARRAMPAETTVTVTIPTTVEGLFGGALTDQHVFSFTTAEGDATPALTVVETIPTDGDESARPWSDINVRFSAPIDFDALDMNSFEVLDVTDADPLLIRGWVPERSGPTSVRLMSMGGIGLWNGQEYQVTVRDVAGFAGGVMAEPYVFTFTVSGFDEPTTTYPADLDFDLRSATGPGGKVLELDLNVSAYEGVDVAVTLIDARPEHSGNTFALDGEDKGYGWWDFRLDSNGGPPSGYSPEWLENDEYEESGWYDFIVRITSDDDGDITQLEYIRSVWIWATEDVPQLISVGGETVSDAAPATISDATPEFIWTNVDAGEADMLSLVVASVDELDGDSRPSRWYVLPLTAEDFTLPESDRVDVGFYLWTVVQQKFDDTMREEVAEGWSIDFGSFFRSLFSYGPDNTALADGWGWVRLEGRAASGVYGGVDTLTGNATMDGSMFAHSSRTQSNAVVGGGGPYAHEAASQSFALLEVGSGMPLQLKGFTAQGGDFFTVSSSPSQSGDSQTSIISIGARRVHTTGFTSSSLDGRWWWASFEAREDGDGELEYFASDLGHVVLTGDATDTGSIDVYSDRREEQVAVAPYQVADDGRLTIPIIAKTGYVGGATGEELFALATVGQPQEPGLLLMGRQSPGFPTAKTVRALTSANAGSGGVTYITGLDHGIPIGATRAVRVRGMSNSDFDTPSGMYHIAEATDTNAFRINCPLLPESGSASVGSVDIYTSEPSLVSGEYKAVLVSLEDFGYGQSTFSTNALMTFNGAGGMVLDLPGMGKMDGIYFVVDERLLIAFGPMLFEMLPCAPSGYTLFGLISELEDEAELLVIMTKAE